MSNYIQEISVTPAVGKITVLCGLTQSDPALICRAIFYCTDNTSSSTLNVSSGTTEDFPTNRLCNVTVQVVSSNNIAHVLDQMAFTNVNVELPSVISKLLLHVVYRKLHTYLAVILGYLYI